jgi:AcrR family transcriptional regulator
MSRVRDPAASREALIAAGERVFNRDGYFATHSNAIAREAGYAPASFYTHFVDKLDLFLTVYERWVLAEWAEIRSVPIGANRTEILEGMISATASRHAQTVIFRRSLRALDALEPRVREARNTQRRDQLNWMNKVAQSLGACKVSLENRIVALLAIERTLDAFADGDIGALRGDAVAVRRSLVNMLEALLFDQILQ